MATTEMREKVRRTMAYLREVMVSLIESTGQSAYSFILAPHPFCGGMTYIQY